MSRNLLISVECECEKLRYESSAKSVAVALKLYAHVVYMYSHRSASLHPSSPCRQLALKWVTFNSETTCFNCRWICLVGRCACNAIAAYGIWYRFKLSGQWSVHGARSSDGRWTCVVNDISRLHRWYRLPVATLQSDPTQFKFSKHTYVWSTSPCAWLFEFYFRNIWSVHVCR